jgi:type VI secretion system secreted protein Hcp
MAFDAFLKIDGIPGESTDDKHKDWIEITHFNHSIAQEASSTASSAGGATLLDKASPKIYEACCTGKHIKDVTVELCRAGGDKQKYLEIKLEQVIISSVASSGTTGDGFPNESVSFSYGKIKWTYVQQKRSDGTGGGNVSAGWDLTANKVAA